jgi:hypothetical protein
MASAAVHWKLCRSAMRRNPHAMSTVTPFRTSINSHTKICGPQLSVPELWISLANTCLCCQIRFQETILDTSLSAVLILLVTVHARVTVQGRKCQSRTVKIMLSISSACDSVSCASATCSISPKYIRPSSVIMMEIYLSYTDRAGAQYYTKRVAETLGAVMYLPDTPVFENISFASTPDDAHTYLCLEVHLNYALVRVFGGDSESDYAVTGTDGQIIFLPISTETHHKSIVLCKDDQITRRVLPPRSMYSRLTRLRSSSCRWSLWDDDGRISRVFFALRKASSVTGCSRRVR